jgi:hypothetical protein
MLGVALHATELLNTEKCIRGEKGKMPKLTRFTRELLKDELVDDALQARLVPALEGHRLAKLMWYPARRGQRPHTLLTPYGTLTVSGYIGRSWTVARNSGPLVWQENPRKEAVFTSVAAAKAAGLIHLRDGFGSSASKKTCLRWKLDCPPATHVGVLNAYDLASGASEPDDHEWGERELKRRLLECTDGYAADVHITRNLERQAESWQLPMPSWTKRASGWYELSSPYGVLAIRRLVGWTVERNNEPLRWCFFGHRVIFDKLEHAQISALVHAYDLGEFSTRDGTHWCESAPIKRVSSSQVPDQMSVSGPDYFRSNLVCSMHYGGAAS